MNHRAYVIGAKRTGHGVPISDIGFDEGGALSEDILERIEGPEGRIAEIVENHGGNSGPFERDAGMRADIAESAGKEDGGSFDHGEMPYGMDLPSILSKARRFPNFTMSKNPLSHFS
ncbi:MAG: hypothetical protein QG650_389 [Patescibacteria group bacterium]|nr:hypothetical protein [Patescibacteria group bacterium]